MMMLWLNFNWKCQFGFYLTLLILLNICDNGMMDTISTTTPPTKIRVCTGSEKAKFGDCKEFHGNGRCMAIVLDVYPYTDVKFYCLCSNEYTGPKCLTAVDEKRGARFRFSDKTVEIVAVVLTVIAAFILSVIVVLIWQKKLYKKCPFVRKEPKPVPFKHIQQPLVA